MKQERVEILFEYKGSRKELSQELYLRPSTVCESIQKELQCMGLTDAVVKLSVMPDKTDCYFLQRYDARNGKLMLTSMAQSRWWKVTSFQ